MSDSASISSFFIEGNKEIKKVFKDSEESISETNFSSDSLTPKLNKVDKAQEQELKKAWKQLRYFFRNGGNKEALNNFSPLLYAPYFGVSTVGEDYPFWISDFNNDNNPECMSLIRILELSINKFAKDSESATLRKNLNRIVRMTAEALTKDNKPVNFKSCINTVFNDVVNSLSLKGKEGDEFVNDINKLRLNIPSDGVLVPYNSDASFYIFGASVHNEFNKRKEKLFNKIAKIKGLLKGMLLIEEDKGKQDPKKLDTAMSFASSLLDFEKMTMALPESASEEMTIERKERISKIISSLELADKLFQFNSYMFIDEGLDKTMTLDWQLLFENTSFEKYRKSEGCKLISSSFEKNMVNYADLFSAIQLGELEINNAYVEEIHKNYFDSFSWRDLNDEEIISCPKFIMICSASSLMDNELGTFSSLLSKGIPIKTFIIQNNSVVNFRNNGKSSNIKFSYRQEIGAIAISHRNVYVAQSTSVKPHNLYNEFINGLSCSLPSVFSILNSSIKDPVNSFKWSNAAVSGREFPGFTFKGGINKQWGSRFNIENNPQLNNSWPTFNIEIQDQEKKVNSINGKFTFADFAFMDSNYSSNFKVIEQKYWSDDLVDISEYLDLSKTDAIGKVPFLWVVDHTKELQKVAISWDMILSCKERLDFWQFLQSNYGINNFHVEKSLESAKESIEEKANEKIEELKAEHKHDLDSVIDTAVNEAMDNLSAALLGMDTNMIVSGLGATKSPLANKDVNNKNVSESESPDLVTEEEDFSMSAEAYIETVLCTSCNECTNLNDNLFKYNGDKMAYINDINAGTYKELVEAAELCPVGIIHPGDPVNLNEDGLEDLKKRAEKFN